MKGIIIYNTKSSNTELLGNVMNIFSIIISEFSICETYYDKRFTTIFKRILFC